MLLLCRSDTPFFVNRRCILIRRRKRLDARHCDHHHLDAGLPLKILADRPDALFPIPIDRLRMVAYITSRLRQLDLEPFVIRRLGQAPKADEAEHHRETDELCHRCSDCDSCSTVRESSVAAWR